MELNKKQVQATIGIVTLASAAATAAVGLYVVGKSISVLRKMDKALEIYIKEHKDIVHISSDPCEEWIDDDEEELKF